MDEDKFRPEMEINFILEDWLFIMNTNGQLLMFKRHERGWRIVNAMKEGFKDGRANT